jgi:hypothetical protein
MGNFRARIKTRYKWGHWQGTSAAKRALISPIALSPVRNEICMQINSIQREGKAKLF